MRIICTQLGIIKKSGFESMGGHRDKLRRIPEDSFQHDREK